MKRTYSTILNGGIAFLIISTFFPFFLGLLLVTGSVVNAQSVLQETKVTIQSPDKNMTVQFYQRQISPGKKAMYYKVSYKGRPVITESALDVQVDNHLSEKAMAKKTDKRKNWCEDLLVKKITTFEKDTAWKPLYGERSMISDHYNGATVIMEKEPYVVHIELRAYNEGIAIRYFFPENGNSTYYRIMSENTAFSLPAGTLAWHTSWGQGPYRLLPLHNWPDESERPLTLQLPGGLYACLAEAQMVDYARTKYTLSKTKPNTIVTSMYTPADLISPVATPWRVIMVAEKPGDLIVNNSIILNLNNPSAIKDVSWIRPGKIFRVMIQTTADAKANIDFAAQHHLQYILFDWKWYGPVFTFQSDATKVAIPDFDLPGIIQYGKEKGIGVWLYVNQQALLAQSDSLFRVYKEWGVKGVKFGFVQLGSHRWTTWLEEMIKKAAQNKIMVNIHDDWRPTGEQRTWPNLLTAEGVRGNEEMPDATHNTVLPFTRYIAGAADYTICYYDKRIKTTHAHQLALAAVYYSPLLTLYWYDKWSDSHNEPELEYWDKMPVSWDETRVLQGTPAAYISMARRSGDEWFIGTITNNAARTVKLSFSFLPPNKKYIAKIYSDDPAAATETKVGITEKEVDASTIIDVKLLPSGGQAIWIKPSL